MIKQTYALRDLTTEVFLNSLTFLNDGEAIRWAQTQVDGDKTQNMIAAHPEQFVLYRLQDFDDKIGRYVPRETKLKETTSDEIRTMPKEICALISLKREEERTFTVKQLLEMLDNRYDNDNVIPLHEEKL